MFVKKTVEFEVNGEKIGFKFGMLASEYFCEMENVTIRQMQKRFEDPTPNTMIHMAMAAARSYNEGNGIEKQLTKSMVADWIDEIGIDEFGKVVYGHHETYQDKEQKEELEKNVIAPMMTEGQNGQ
jgi:selenocysteine lyase/cysteine desulfurase